MVMMMMTTIMLTMETLFDFLCDNPPMPTYLPFSPCVQHLQQFLSVGIFLVRFPNPHFIGEPD